MKSRFLHADLEFINPDFGSLTTDFIIELEHLRKKDFEGSLHPKLFIQLKKVFHMLESIASASIDGNNITITDFIEATFEEGEVIDGRVLEIQNIEKSISFIEKNIDSIEIKNIFISELHKHIKLVSIGDRNEKLGFYRNIETNISNTLHKPPAPFKIRAYMDALFTFIANDDAPKYDFLKTALAHHRFVWIHPFTKGNGKAVRLFTYAMLIKQGFNVNKGRIINISTIFSNDSDLYYKYLSNADNGTKSGLLNWCEFVLNGLKTEIKKADKLLDYKFLSKNILLKAILYSKEIEQISDIEFQILKVAVEKQVFQAADLEAVFKGKHSAEISRNLKRLKDKKLIISEKENGRKYLISFQNKTILKGVIRALDKKGFLPILNK